MTLIVIINCQSGLAHALDTALQHVGYQTLTAVDADEAILMLDQQVPSLILLGETRHPLYQQTSTLKEHMLTQHAPIIAQADDFSVLNAAYRARLGIQAVIQRPHSMPQFLHDVRQWIDVPH